MHQVNLQDAEAQLEQLIEEAANGEDVIIVRNDRASFKIVPVAAAQVRPKFGSAKGLVSMSENFDEPLEDVEDYAP